MPDRPHRIIVAIDVAPGADLAAILDAIEGADPAVIAAGDLLTVEMQAQPTTIKITVPIPSRLDPGELHRQRDPHCSCNDCQQHWIDSTAEALTEETIAETFADLTREPHRR